MLSFETQHWIPIVIFSKAITVLQKISRRHFMFFSEVEEGIALIGVIIIRESISRVLVFSRKLPVLL